jgi:hypothetical protein
MDLNSSKQKLVQKEQGTKRLTVPETAVACASMGGHFLRPNLPHPLNVGQFSLELQTK